MRLNPIITQPMFDADQHFLGSEEQIFQIQRQQKPRHSMPDTQPLTLLARHMPDAVPDFLRFQFGILSVRLQSWPIYDEAGLRVIGQKPTSIPCTVFHLLGHGSSEAAALRMARRAFEKLTPTQA